MWDADSGKLLQTFAGHYDTVWSAAFSVDGTRLVTAGHDGLVMMWDTTNGQPMLSLRGQTGAVASAVFSPDGERIATGSRDGTIKLWDSAGGRERLTLLGADAQEGVDSVVFSPDGRQLIVRGDHAVRVYAISIDALAAGVQARLTRSWTAEECRRFLHLEECPKNM